MTCAFEVPQMRHTTYAKVTTVWMRTMQNHVPSNLISTFLFHDTDLEQNDMHLSNTG